MKKLMLIGGAAGFSIALVCGLRMENAQWPGVMFRASLGCLGGGLLLRWWGKVWLQSLHEVEEQQRAAEAKAQEKNGPKVPWKVNTHANNRN